MRLLFLIAGLFTCSITFGQTSIIGKWKPVFFNIDSMITADVKADTTFLSAKLDEALKDDKDPKASKEMMVFVAEMMLNKMKVTEEEFTSTAEYIITDRNRNKSSQGTYTLDGQNNLVITTVKNETHTFKVSFKNDNLILTGELENREGKKGKLLVEYERVK